MILFASIPFHNYSICNQSINQSNNHHNIVITKTGTLYPDTFVIVDGHYDTSTGTGTNDNGYSLGNKLDASAWAAKQVSKSTSLSFRLKALDWDNIDGSDNKLVLMPNMVPTADPNLRGGTRVDALVGINFVPPGLTRLRFAAEVGAPMRRTASVNGMP